MSVENWVALDTIQLSESIWCKRARHTHLSICNQTSQGVLFLDFFLTLMDISVIWVLLLDVIQATGVWFQDGCVMEHLVESDAQEDHIELRERQRFTERERLYVSCFTSIHFKSEHFVAQSWNTAARLGFPLCQTEHKIQWHLCGGIQTKQGTVREDSCILVWGSLSIWLIHTCLIIFTLRDNAENNCHCFRFRLQFLHLEKKTFGIDWNFLKYLKNIYTIMFPATVYHMQWQPLMCGI